MGCPSVASQTPDPSPTPGPTSGDIAALAKSMDRVALGHNFGPRELGFYQNALNVYENAINVSANALHNVATPTLSKLRDDLDALKRAWSTALSSLVFFAAPAFAVLAVVGLTVEAAWAGGPVGAPAPLLAAGIPAFLALGGGVLVTKLIRRFRNRKE